MVPLDRKTSCGDMFPHTMSWDLKNDMGRKGIFSMLSTWEGDTPNAFMYPLGSEIHPMLLCMRHRQHFL